LLKLSKALFLSPSSQKQSKKKGIIAKKEINKMAKLETVRSIEEAKAVAPSVLDKLQNYISKAIPISTILSLILAACAAAAQTPTPEIPPAGSPQAGETSVPTEATAATEASPYYQQALEQIPASPYYDGIYFQESQKVKGEEMEEVVKRCASFFERLGDRISPAYNIIAAINAYNICYAQSENQVIFDVWDAEGPLYVTVQGGFDFLQKVNLTATSGKTEKDFTIDPVNANNAYAILRNLDGESTGVGVGADGQ